MMPTIIVIFLIEWWTNVTDTFISVTVIVTVMWGLLYVIIIFMTISVEYQPIPSISLMTVIEPFINNGRALRNINNGNPLQQNDY